MRWAEFEHPALANQQGRQRRGSSYLQTMRNRGYNPPVAIQIALSGEIYEQGGE